MARPRRTQEPCPECGEPLSAGGTFCRACGFDAAAAEAGEEGEFDYDDFLDSEGLAGPAGGGGRGRGREKKLFWTAVAIVVLAAFILVFVIS